MVKRLLVRITGEVEDLKPGCYWATYGNEFVHLYPMGRFCANSYVKRNTWERALSNGCAKEI